MAHKDKRLDAEKLYIKDGLSCAAIASALKVNEGTVYRWKNEAAEQGDGADWDAQRRVYNLSPREMFAMYAESVKAFIVQLQKSPEQLGDGKIADAIAKHVSVLQKLDTRGQYKGVALDLIKVINVYISENLPEVKEKLEPHWDAIFERLIKYATEKGMF